MKISIVGKDPLGHRINCCAFQQDAVITAGGFQYVVSYKPVNSVDRLTTIARRKPDGNWHILEFQDYIQSKDDGHNVMCMGISGDGVIHLAWDMHGDEIHYRYSVPGAASSEKWDISMFSGVLTSLPGTNFTFDELTYPRFQTLDSGDMLLEFREGRSGLGDCCLYRYNINSGQWTPVALPYIKGVNNNAYLHGFDYFNGVLHVSWTYRDYVPDRQDNSKITSQAGPNGPENNHDLHYIYSEDEGQSWRNSQGILMPTPIDISHDTLVMEIPKFSGIMNQEGQCVDRHGGVHVLGRENGIYHHYYRDPQSKVWSKTPINGILAPLFGARGKLVARDVLYALLPLPNLQFTVLTSPLGQKDHWIPLFTLENTTGEPLYDRYSDTLSILQIHNDNVVLIDI